jgi:hypothetical protein
VVVLVCCAVWFLGDDVTAILPNPEQSADLLPAVSGVVVDSSSGRPIAGAIVTLSTYTIGARGTGAMSTDPDGRFVFVGLSPARTYVLTATRFGYVPGRFGSGDPEFGTGTQFALGEREWLKTAKILLTRPSSITGRIVDEADEPVVNALVRLLSIVTIGGRPQLAALAAVKTDDRGVYRVSSLAPGRYVVMVPSVQMGLGPTDDTRQPTDSVVVVNRAKLKIGDYLTPPPPSNDGALTYPVMFYPSARSAADAMPIDLQEGADRSNVDIRVVPAPAVEVDGSVIAPPEARLSGLTIRLVPAGNEGLGLGAESATAVLDADGSFAFSNVASGLYTMIVSPTTFEYTIGSLNTMPKPPGFVETASGFGAVMAGVTDLRYTYRNQRGLSSAYSAHVPITIGQRNEHGVVISLQRTLSISGRLVSSSPLGQQSARLPIVIWAEPAEGDPTLGVPGTSATTSEPYRFGLDGLLPGKYVLRVQAGNHRVKSITWLGRDFTYQPFDMSSNVEGVTIELTSEKADLTGMIRDAAGTPAEATILVFPVERTQWSAYGFRPLRVAVRHATQSFKIDTLPAGEYYIAALTEPSIPWLDTHFLEAVVGSASRVKLTWGATSSVDLIAHRIASR